MVLRAHVLVFLDICVAWWLSSLDRFPYFIRQPSFVYCYRHSASHV